MTKAVNAGDPLAFECGLTMNNRFMLAPMTNTQSHGDGTLSDDELRWLTLRAEGGFGLTMTCASHVQRAGQGFPGQLGCCSDDHLAGLSRLASRIREAGSLAVVQLFHAGLRAPAALIGQAPQSASEHAKSGARALSTEEVEQLRDDFVAAAARVARAGFDGVEIHAAHGYIVAQFLSASYNRREDRFGGSLDNRARLLFEIVEGVRAACGPGFLLGVRVSPERFGMRLSEVLEVSQQLLDSGLLDLLDVSLWDVFKQPHEEAHRGRSLLEHVMGLRRGNVKLTVAGNIRTAADVERVLTAGADFVTVGRAAILHHDFPRRVLADADFEATAPPVSPEYLAREGVGPAFVEYLRRWQDFVTR